MNRRGFLAMLTGAALDPERLLWVPGRKLISIPRPGNTLLSPEAISWEILMRLRQTWALEHWAKSRDLWPNHIVTPRIPDLQIQPKAFALGRSRIGDTIIVKKPRRFT